MRVSIPLDRQCQFARLPVPEAEYPFAKAQKRKWRFDWAWPEQKLALEIQGGAFIGGRHTSGVGFEKDAEKFSAAAILGWRVLHVLPKHVASGVALVLVEQALRADGRIDALRGQP
jgi:hypothetical protein